MKTEIEVRLHDRFGTSSPWTTFDTVKGAREYVKKQDPFFSGNFLVDYNVYDEKVGCFQTQDGVLKTHFLKMKKAEFMDRNAHPPRHPLDAFEECDEIRHVPHVHSRSKENDAL